MFKTFIQSEYLSLCEDEKLQSKYAKLESLGLINGVEYPIVFRLDWIRLVMRRVHNPGMWLAKGAFTPIMKENLCRVTSYN